MVEFTREAANEVYVAYMPKLRLDIELHRQVKRVVQEWSDGFDPDNCVLGWANKTEITSRYDMDEEVNNFVLMDISDGYVWVIGSDLMSDIARYAEHVTIVQPKQVQVGKTAAEMGCLCDACKDDVEADKRFERAIREIGDVIKALGEEEDEERTQARLAKERDRVYFEVIERIANERTDMISLESEAREYVRSKLNAEQVAPMDWQILEEVAACLCLNGLGDNELHKHTLLFSLGRTGHVDHMQVYLEDVGRCVDIHLSDI